MDGVEVGFVERNLRALDLVTADIVVGALCEDERPPRGLAGLVDWRLGGRLSVECQRGFLTGVRGEKFLLPARPRLPFEKALIVGLGRRESVDEDTLKASLELVLDTLESLRVRRAAAEFPGRHLGAVPMARAMELLWSALDERTGTLESLLVIDDRDAQKVFDAAKARPARRSLAGRR